MCVCVFPGGHDNFRKMIDEAEPLGYPVVVKNARGHRGKTIRVFLPVTRSIHNATPQKKKKKICTLQAPDGSSGPPLYEIH